MNTGSSDERLDPILSPKPIGKEDQRDDNEDHIQSRKGANGLIIWVCAGIGVLWAILALYRRGKKLK